MPVPGNVIEEIQRVNGFISLSIIQVKKDTMLFDEDATVLSRPKPFIRYSQQLPLLPRTRLKVYFNDVDSLTLGDLISSCNKITGFGYTSVDLYHNGMFMEENDYDVKYRASINYNFYDEER